MKTVAFHFGPKNYHAFRLLFYRNHVTKNFKKSPNLVTLQVTHMSELKHVAGFFGCDGDK